MSLDFFRETNETKKQSNRATGKQENMKLKLSTILISSITAILFAVTSFASPEKSQQPSLAQWIINNTDHYTSIEPSKGTTAASVNIPIDNYSIKKLNGNAMLISIHLNKQKETTNITWEDGTESTLSEKKFVPLLTFLESNSLGMPIKLIHGDPEENITAYFGGIHTQNN